MHNDAKAFADQAAAPGADETLRFTHSTQGMLRFLWQRTDQDSLSDAELEWLASMESIEIMAQSLSRTLAGVAALVDSDMTRESPRSGALQSDTDLPQFLWGAADTAATIEEWVNISSDAAFFLRERDRKRADSAG